MPIYKKYHILFFVVKASKAPRKNFSTNVTAVTAHIAGFKWTTIGWLHSTDSVWNQNRRQKDFSRGLI